MTARPPKISVVIPTYDRLSQLRRVLRGFAAQTVPPDTFETIVVSDGSTDGTDDYLTSGALPLPVRFVRQHNRGPAAARNAGVATAGGELVLFVDDDVVPAPDLIERHLAQHRRADGDVAVMGPMLTPPDHVMSPWVAYEQAMLEKQYEAMRRGAWEPTARQFFTGNASVGRAQVLAAGGFDPRFTRAEDVELAYRLAARGVHFVFDPDAVGLHYAARSYASWRRTPYLYGRHDVVFARDRGQDWLLPEVRKELTHHHALLRVAVRTTAGRPLVRRSLVRTCEVTARVTTGRVARAALSAVYNLAYHDGIADELGDPRWLRATPPGRADGSDDPDPRGTELVP